jgi:hypothetical protein
MDNIRKVRHKYHSSGFNANTKNGLEKIKGISNKLDIIFENLPKCIIETIGDQRILREQINDFIQSEIQNAVKTQLVEIPIMWLNENDLIFDYKRKTIQRVDYISPYNSKMDGEDKPNTVMVAYKGDEDCENFDIKTRVDILVNPTVSQLINFTYDF